MHARRRIRTAVAGRLDDKVQALEGRVYAGRVGALVSDGEVPAGYVDVSRSDVSPELFDEQASAILRTYLVEITLVHRGPDAGLAEDGFTAADLVDELAFDAEAGFAREDVLGGALGFAVVDWRIAGDALVLKDASLPLAHLNLRYLLTVAQADGSPTIA